MTPSPILYMYVLTDGEYTGQWPPETPDTEMDENHVFTLQKDPWTYGNESFNPDLRPSPSNNGLRERDGSPHDDDEPRPPYEHFSRPPYADEDEDENDYNHDDRLRRRQFIRRGSEGYEVRPINREEMMKQYVDSQPQLAAFARAQERANRGEESDDYGVSDQEGDGDNRFGNEEEVERGVRERMSEPGRYRPYVPERWESEDEEGEEVEHIPNGLPVQG